MHGIEVQWMTESSAETFNQWFDTVESREIALHNIYNMDETGNSICTLQRAQVIVNSTSQMQYQAQPGRQEWVTAVECKSSLYRLMARKL